MKLMKVELDSQTGGFMKILCSNIFRILSKKFKFRESRQDL